MTHAMMQRILEGNPVREVCWRSGKGLQRLCSKYGAERVEAACARALHLGAHSYKPIERLLRLGRDEMALPGQQPEERPSIVHDNVRGPTITTESYARLFSKLAKADVLVIDDLGLGSPKEAERHDLLEVM
jgi:hypothetical protein